MTLGKAWYPETRWLIVGMMFAAALWAANADFRLGYAISDMHTQMCQAALDSTERVNAGLIARRPEAAVRGAR